MIQVNPTIQVNQTPKEGEFVDIETSNPPDVDDEILLIKGDKPVAIGIVTEVRDQGRYRVLVVESIAGEL